MPLIPNNDDHCGWLEVLPKRKANAPLSGNKRTKWLVVGAGYTGLSAAITLAENSPNDEVLLIDAQRAGEGASSRNSGFLVDSTLNDGHLSSTSLTDYISKYELNRTAISAVKSLVTKHRINCDWNECGKFHATSDAKDTKKLLGFHELLKELQIPNILLDSDKLAESLGTDFYKAAVFTEGGVMLQPAALALGMIEALPENITLYENTPAHQIIAGPPHRCVGEAFEIIADKMIVAINSYMPSLGIKKNRVLPLLLTASLTRRLNSGEQELMHNVSEWGVLSAREMGATVRYTSDKRLMIRNTVEVSESLDLNATQMADRQKTHMRGLLRRFPFLVDDVIEHSWSGTTCVSANNANVFEQLDKDYWVVGCYNGGGLGLAVLYGQEIAYLALNTPRQVVDQIAQMPSAAWLPPQPFLNMGVRVKLAIDRLGSRNEI